MKKSFTIFTILLSSLFFLSMVSEMPVKSFVMTVTGLNPVLPDDPFTYSDIEFPDHLFPEEPNGINDTIGYGRGEAPDREIFETVTDHGATLGRVLFYDKKLSAVENISCGSCHKQELSFAENKSFSEGINSETMRNSMQLNDLLWTNADRFTWDMQVSNLHEMIILPLTDVNEIGANIDDVRLKLEATEYYPQLFMNAFGESEISEEKIVDALVQFITSMNTFGSKFDTGVKTDFEDFTASEKLGLDLFGEHCTSCHNQGRHDPFSLFINPELFSNGLPPDPDDKGMGEWQQGYNNLFKKPTLRNVELNGPYMHDGRFLTLEDVVDHYSDELVENAFTGMVLPKGGFHFDVDQKTALVDFMKTLTDRSFITNPRWSDPFNTVLETETLQTEILALMPNPMNDRALMKFSNPDSKVAIINIISQDGRFIKHDETTKSEYEIIKSDFGVGVYFIQVIIGNRKASQKLIVQ